MMLISQAEAAFVFSRKANKEKPKIRTSAFSTLISSVFNYTAAAGLLSDSLLCKPLSDTLNVKAAV